MDLPPPYERFRAWHACHALAVYVYELTEHWPARERFGLSIQVRRAAWSAAASIVEGSAKRGAREFARYLDIANGSIAEVRYGIRLATDLGYISTSEAVRLKELIAEASKLTFSLYKGVRRRAVQVGVRPTA